MQQVWQWTAGIQGRKIPTESAQYQLVDQIVADFSEQLKIDKPRLELRKNRNDVAFAIKHEHKVIVNSGLLKRGDEEVRWTIAHELAHFLEAPVVRRAGPRFAWVTPLIAALPILLVALGALPVSFVWLGFILQVLAWPLAMRMMQPYAIQLQENEHSADLVACRLTSLAALEKIAAREEQGTSQFSRWLDEQFTFTHPSWESRVAYCRANVHQDEKSH
jgi:Zn-dependent protease with chaperone function